MVMEWTTAKRNIPSAWHKLKGKDDLLYRFECHEAQDNRMHRIYMLLASVQQVHIHVWSHVVWYMYTCTCI